jgi:hypothetical protein
MNRFFPLVPVFAVLVTGSLAMGQQQPAEPPQAAEEGRTVEAWDPLLDLPPLSPDAKPTLVGGTVRELDRVRNRLTVDVFGGGRMQVNFDDRTQIHRDGVEVTQLGIRKGDRIYLDTILHERKVFAKNIHVQTEIQPADTRGQLLSYNRRRGVMTVRDQLLARPITFQVTENTTIVRDGGQGSLLDLVPGALVDVKFSPKRADRGQAEEVVVLATPGSSFLFAGELTHLDLRSGILAVQNRTDDRNYELFFDRARTPVRDELRAGAEVRIRAVFDGGRYVVRDLEIQSPRALPPEPEDDLELDEDER